MKKINVILALIVVVFCTCCNSEEVQPLKNNRDGLNNEEPADPKPPVPLYKSDY